MRRLWIACILALAGCSTPDPSSSGFERGPTTRAEDGIYFYSVLWTAEGIGPEGAYVEGQVEGCLHAESRASAIAHAHRLMRAAVPHGDLLADRVEAGCPE